MNITHEQLAEILAGIGSANAAVINAVADREMVAKKIRPALSRASGHGDPTLQTLYPRLLLASLHGPHPASTQVRDLFASELAHLIPKA